VPELKILSHNGRGIVGGSNDGAVELRGLGGNGRRSWEEAGISFEDASRIQNAANRTRQRIIVVGSRANGMARITSDWDYIFTGSAAQRHSAKSSVPRGISGGEINSTGRESGIDIFAGPLDENAPHVIFEPE
jgi:hypothetical protein